MRKVMMIAAATAALSVSGTASAQALSSNETINIEGTVALACGVINNSIANPEPLDLTSAAAQTLGSYTYICNNAGGFTRTFTSANGGKLAAANSPTTIAYNFSSGGGSGLGFAATSLSTPKVTSLAGSGAFIAGQTGGVSVTVGAASGPLYAGTYKDTITMTIVPN